MFHPWYNRRSRPYKFLAGWIRTPLKDKTLTKSEIKVTDNRLVIDHDDIIGDLEIWGAFIDSDCSTSKHK